MELIAQDYGLMFIFSVNHYFVLLIQMMYIVGGKVKFFFLK